MTRAFNHLLLFSLFGIAMWFFGNLYEAIVIGPNMLQNSVHQLQAWRNFFVVTNPVFFYVPVPQLATVAVIILFIKTPADKTEIKRYLKTATIFQVVSIILSVYIITQLNMKLFFGDLSQYQDQLNGLALQWNILNLIRVCMAAVVLVFVFRAYVQTQKLMN
jgi:hypothetical protein